MYSNHQKYDSSILGLHKLFHNRSVKVVGVKQLSCREVNNRLTGWAFAHLVNYFAYPVN